MLMTRPQPLASMPSMTCLVVLNRPVRLVSITVLQFSGDILRKVPLVHHVEGLAGAVPVGDVAVDAVEVEARLELLGNPGGLAAGVGITAHHHGESIPMQALADRRTDTAHTTGDQCYTCRIARNTH
ncbi:hypothetical protein G6F24_010982 [Rhizopus arrhizus]|nr:hypothetical protein G6F24_010982 [Rhizopus arrhizus]